MENSSVYGCLHRLVMGRQNEVGDGQPGALAQTSQVVVGDMTPETWCRCSHACAAAGCHQQYLHPVDVEDKVDAFAHLGVQSALCVRRGSRGTGRTVALMAVRTPSPGVPQPTLFPSTEPDEPDRSFTLNHAHRARRDRPVPSLRSRGCGQIRPLAAQGHSAWASAARRCNGHGEPTGVLG